MKLILLYGAPATGKLTIATELAKLTGYTLFHNHIILNALSELFDYEHPVRRKLEKEFRLRIIEEAVKANIDLIATGVIMKDNESFYRKMINTVLENSGECLLVQLIASNESLERRIDNQSRKKLKKITTKERLREWSQQYPESFEKIDYVNQITIDTSNASPDEVSRKIIKTFSLS